MKNTIRTLGLGIALAVSALLLKHSPEWAGAAETGLTGEQGKARMEAVRDEVSTLRSNIFLTLVVLDQVRGEREPQGTHFQAFTNQMARMEDLARMMGKRTDEMKKRGDAYFLDWEAKMSAIQEPEARQRAEERYGERKKSYDIIARSMQDARADFFPFVAALTKIKTLLEGQRDEKSVAAAKDLFMRANWHCIDVQRALMGTEEELDQLAASFAKDK
jgi:hypothetical protein